MILPGNIALYIVDAVLFASVYIDSIFIRLNISRIVTGNEIVGLCILNSGHLDSPVKAALTVNAIIFTRIRIIICWPHLCGIIFSQIV